MSEERKLKPYRISDYEIYAGWDGESAVAAAMEDHDCERTDYYEEVELLPDDYQVTDIDENEKPIGAITLRELIDRDLSEPGMLAGDL